MKNRKGIFNLFSWCWLVLNRMYLGLNLFILKYFVVFLNCNFLIEKQYYQNMKKRFCPIEINRYAICTLKLFPILVQLKIKSPACIHFAFHWQLLLKSNEIVLKLILNCKKGQKSRERPQKHSKEDHDTRKRSERKGPNAAAGSHTIELFGPQSLHQ